MRGKRLGLVDPDFVIWLREQVSRDAQLRKRLSDFSVTGVSRSSFINGLRAPALMSKVTAERLLDASGLRAEWEHYKSSAPTGKRYGVFDYNSRRLGLVREMDIERCLAVGLNINEIANQLVSIDLELFDAAKSSDWVGSVSDWSEILSEYPDTWRVFVNDKNEIIGYWMYVSPTSEYFYKSCVGEYPEYEITLNTLQPLNSAQTFIYGPGIYIKKRIDHQNYNWDRNVLGSSLVMSFFYHIRRMERAGIKFERICVAVYTPEGRDLAEAKFKLPNMPKHVAERYAARMDWELREQKDDLLPQVYYSIISPSTRAAMGLGEW